MCLHREKITIIIKKKRITFRVWSLVETYRNGTTGFFFFQLRYPSIVIFMGASLEPESLEVRSRALWQLYTVPDNSYAVKKVPNYHSGFNELFIRVKLVLPRLTPQLTFATLKLEAVGEKSIVPNRPGLLDSPGNVVHDPENQQKMDTIYP